jgi:hypothetical protein
MGVVASAQEAPSGYDPAALALEGPAQGAGIDLRRAPSGS